MSKYIIELGEDANMVQVISVTQSGNAYIDSTVYVGHLEQLNSDYINEHFGDLQDTAYQKGINDGSLDVKQRVEGAYQKGLDEAWKAARRISVIELNGGLAGKELMKIYGTMDIHKIYDDNTASEAIEKLKAYEEQKADDEIKVGDEVIERDGNKILVSNIHGELFDGLCSDGSTICDLFLEDVVKTGRHFDIGKILEEMRK